MKPKTRKEKIVLKGLLKGIAIAKGMKVVESHCLKYGWDEKILELYEKMCNIYSIRKANRKIIRLMKRISRKAGQKRLNRKG